MIWLWIKRFLPVVAVVSMIAIALIGLGSYLSINVRQQDKEQQQTEVKQKQQNQAAKQQQDKRDDVFAHPTKYQTGKVMHSAKYQDLVSSAVRPAKVLDRNNHVIMTNPDAWRIQEVQSFKSGVVKYIGQNGQWAVGYGITFAARDYTVKELQKYQKAGTQLFAANLLKDQKVTKQTGPYVMYKQVAVGDVKPSQKTRIQAPVGSGITINKIVSHAGRTFIVTPQNTYVEAQRYFLLPNANA